MRRLYETIPGPIVGLFLVIAGLLVANTVIARVDEEDEAFLPAAYSGPAPSSVDWSMVAANPQRTSWSPEEVTGRLQVEWYRPIEAYIPQNSQIIAASNLLYITTSRGLVALRAANGEIAWRFNTEMPLGNSPSVSDGVLYVGGYDRKLHALDARTGSHLWSFDGAGAGYDTNPLVVDGVVYAGNRDGKMYAIGAHRTTQQGQQIWSYQTGGAIHLSAAYSEGTIYFAANDNYAYALDAATGDLTWKSERLPGLQYQSYWPTIYQDKVVFSVASGYRRGMSPGTRSPDYTGEHVDLWPEQDDQEERLTLGPEVSGQNWSHGYPVIDASRATEYLEDNPDGDPHKHKPWRRSIVVLNREDGSEYTFDSDQDGYPEHMPGLWMGTGSGNRYPPIVGPDNILYLSNRYDCCASPKGRVMGWRVDSPSYLSILYGETAVAEPQAISGGGNMIYRNLCCDRFGDWFSIMEPGPGSRGELWGYDLAAQAPGYDSMWTIISGLPRLKGYYKGDSDSVNAAYHNHGDQNPIVPYQGRLYVHRSNAIIAFGTGSGPGALPLLRIDESYDAPGSSLTQAELTTRLEREIQKIVDAGHLRPGYYNVSQFLTGGLEDYFQSPGDTILTLAMAHPHLSPELQAEVESYLQQEFETYFETAMYAHIGWADGTPREDMILPPEVAADLINHPPRELFPGFLWFYPQYNFYAMWKYAELFPSEANLAYDLAKSKLQVPVPDHDGDHFEKRPYEVNAWIMGYVGFLELQDLAGMSEIDSQLRTDVSNELSRLLQYRVDTFTKDSYWTTDFAFHAKHLDLARNFLFLAPELADYMNEEILQQVEEAVAEYEYIAPYWFVSRYESVIGEGVMSNLYNYHALFLAKAYILREPGSELTKYVDVPAFARGDLFYIQNLVAALEAQS